MFEVDVKNVTEEGRREGKGREEGEDQARFFTWILRKNWGNIVEIFKNYCGNIVEMLG